MRIGRRAVNEHDLCGSGPHSNFKLRELPVEVPDGESNGKHRVFVISLGLLKELHDKYGLEAILLGSVFCNCSFRLIRILLIW